MEFYSFSVPLLVAGIAIEAVLAIALLRTGRGVLLAPMAAVACIVVTGVALERLILTEGERVELALNEAARAIEADNLDRVLACVAPEAASLHADAHRYHDFAHFTQIRIRNLEVQVNRNTPLPTAKSTFLALVTAGDRSGAVHDVTQPVKVRILLRKESGRWLITEYHWTQSLSEEP
jgi:hypothetical protein